MLVQESDCLCRVRINFVTRRMIDVADFVRNSPIAINEDCVPLHCLTSARTSFIIKSALLKTSSGVIAVIHLWSIGQSLSMHGAQSGGRRIISAVFENGRVVVGSVGPKMTSVGRFRAEAI